MVILKFRNFLLSPPVSFRLSVSTLDSPPSLSATSAASLDVWSREALPETKIFDQLGHDFMI